MDMSLSKLWEMAKSGKPGVLQSMGSQRVEYDWATEQDIKLMFLNPGYNRHWDLTSSFPKIDDLIPAAEILTELILGGKVLDREESLVVLIKVPR